ncbi:phosphonate metabolism protein/1,5-bisphosphokinase (PRPP-forming) PhnN [Dyella sp. 2RAB6]|uniref:phosphonate metabolism protein/1,5-bisphosphokinase (PRPP-forming) PhnN n=1 Tax=Dyella sp. 2RAB6 TaxID=3232992 RepID=UPI003F93591E
MSGRLFYVMGPSGAGKDSVLGWVREHGISHGMVCAHRYITRPAHAGGENHVALSVEEFESRERRGLFVLTWQAHGLRYGVGREVEQWLARDADVLVNGSRAAYGQACERFPGLRPVVITASREVMAARLIGRGRESAEDIAARLDRAEAWRAPPGTMVIRNDGNLADAGALLLDAIKQKEPA